MTCYIIDYNYTAWIYVSVLDYGLDLNKIKINLMPGFYINNFCIQIVLGLGLDLVI